jgi:hypothetical protein
VRQIFLKIGLIISAIAIVLYLLVFYELDAPDRRFGLAFNPYPDSELIYQTVLSGDYPLTKVLVYWTSTSRGDLQPHHYINRNKLLVRNYGNTYYVSDAQFGYATGPLSFEICAHSVDPQELTTINIYFQPASGETVIDLEPVWFGCAFNLTLDASAIPVRDSGTYIIVGYNTLTG